MPYREPLGHAIIALEQRQKFNAACVTNHRVCGRVIVLTFDSSTPMVFDNGCHPVLHSLNCSTLGNAADLEIVDALAIGDNEVTVRQSSVPPEGHRVEFCYAYRQRVLNEDPIDYVVATGALRECWERPCRALPDRMIYRWLPAFMIEL